MRCIGLTGGICTGKSTVARLLAGLGATVVDADRLAREVVVQGQPALAEIAERFGNRVLDPRGGVARSALAEIVFGDPEARRALEKIVHPRVSALLDERIADAERAGVDLVVLDLPLLYEWGHRIPPDGVIVVYAPPATQRERLRARDVLGAMAAQARIDAQMPIDEKRARATWVIDNRGDREATFEQVRDWWAEHGLP